MEVIEQKFELIQVAQDQGISKDQSNFLNDQFIGFLQKSKEWEELAFNLVITDVSQNEEMQQARDARLSLRKIRTEADKKRKELKAESLKYGKAVQSVYNIIEYRISKIEKHLLKQEQFVQRKEAERKAQIKIERETIVQPYIEFIPFVDLGDITEEDFQRLLSGAKAQLKLKVEAEKRAEAERIEREKKEAEESERIRKENERLRAEAAKREAERQKEIEKQRKVEEARRKEEAEKQAELQAKIEAERKAKEQAEAELRRKRDEQERKIREEEARVQAELNKGDAAKVRDLVHDLQVLKSKYAFKSKRNRKMYEDVGLLIDKVINHINK